MPRRGKRCRATEGGAAEEGCSATEGGEPPCDRGRRCRGSEGDAIAQTGEAAMPGRGRVAVVWRRPLDRAGGRCAGAGELQCDGGGGLADSGVHSRAGDRGMASISTSDAVSVPGRIRNPAFK